MASELTILRGVCTADLEVERGGAGRVGCGPVGGNRGGDEAGGGGLVGWWVGGWVGDAVKGA